MLAFYEFGSGPAVLLLHGFPLDHTIWEHQVESLAANYRVILADLPGLGRSSPLPTAQVPTTAVFAEQVLALMDARKLGEVALVGHSLGGYVALALANMAPFRVNGLALVGSQALPDSREARQNRLSLIRRVQEQGSDALVESMLDKLLAPSLPADSPLRAEVKAIIRRTSVQGSKAALLALAHRPDMTPNLYNIAVPVLVLTGDQDQAVPPERSEEMAAVLPDASFVRVTGAGHLPMMESPEAVTQALERWLERVYS